MTGVTTQFILPYITCNWI